MFLLVPAYPGSPGQKAIKRLCVCDSILVDESESQISPDATGITTNTSSNCTMYLHSCEEDSS